MYENPDARCLDEGEEWVPAVTFVLDPTREKLLVGAADGELLTFDAESLDLISRRDFDPERGVELYGGSWLAVGDEARRTFGVGSTLTIVDADTFEDVATLPGTMVALSADGALLALHGEAGRITLYDTATWQPLREFGAGESRIRGLSFSPDGLFVLSAGSDGFVRIWDVKMGAEIHRLPVESPADGAWIDDDHVAVVSRDRLEVFTLDVDELLGIAGDRLIRGLTSDECSTYRIDPCPSLDEIRGR